MGLSTVIKEFDPLLIHTMILHEERGREVAALGRFGFSVQGIHLDYGETEFCLITGLKFGPSANLLGPTKTPKNSILRSRLFPNETDQSVRLRYIEEYILGPRFLTTTDDDAVMIVQMFFTSAG